MRWVEQVACVAKMRNEHKFQSETMKGSDHMQNTGIDGMIILQ